MFEKVNIKKCFQIFYTRNLFAKIFFKKKISKINFISINEKTKYTIINRYVFYSTQTINYSKHKYKRIKTVRFSTIFMYLLLNWYNLLPKKIPIFEKKMKNMCFMTWKERNLIDDSKKIEIYPKNYAKIIKSIVNISNHQYFLFFYRKNLTLAYSEKLKFEEKYLNSKSTLKNFLYMNNCKLKEVMSVQKCENFIQYQLTFALGNIYQKFFSTLNLKNFLLINFSIFSNLSTLNPLVVIGGHFIPKIFQMFEKESIYKRFNSIEEYFDRVKILQYQLLKKRSMFFTITQFKNAIKEKKFFFIKTDDCILKWEKFNEVSDIELFSIYYNSFLVKNAPFLLTIVAQENTRKTKIKLLLDKNRKLLSKLNWKNQMCLQVIFKSLYDNSFSNIDKKGFDSILLDNIFYSIILVRDFLLRNLYHFQSIVNDQGKNLINNFIYICFVSQRCHGMNLLF